MAGRLLKKLHAVDGVLNKSVNVLVSSQCCMLKEWQLPYMCTAMLHASRQPLAALVQAVSVWMHDACTDLSGDVDQPFCKVGTALLREAWQLWELRLEVLHSL